MNKHGSPKSHEEAKVPWPKRLYSLDITRGVAAVGVVLWHWQHFYYSGVSLPSDFDKTSQPGYVFARVFYEYGGMGVEYFFLLSGFVFFWLYGDRIHRGGLSSRNFWIQRLARLYPLHLVSLLAVAILQFINHGTDGSFFVYAINDSYHFLLNLVMAAGWGCEAGYSFNGPAWSLSVEVFVYGLFFALSRQIRPGFFACFCLAVLALLAVFPLMARQVLFYKVCLGAGFFLLGGAAYAVTRKLTMAPAKVRNCVHGISAMAWLLVGLKNFGISLLPTSISSHWGSLLSSGFPVGLFFSTVVTLALWEIRAAEKSILLMKRFSWIGDVSFSVYLLHFPLQIVCHMLSVRLGMDGRQWFDWRFLVGFLSAILILARLSFKYFEVPMRGWIRRRYGQAPQGPEAA